MKFLCAFALTMAAFACGGGTPKKESAIVQGADVSPNCCCKTIPATAEKEIVPNYTMTPRMECSSSHGDCVDDVQCNNQSGDQSAPATGNPGDPPPPPDLPSSP